MRPWPSNMPSRILVHFGDLVAEPDRKNSPEVAARRVIEDFYLAPSVVQFRNLRY